MSDYRARARSNSESPCRALHQSSSYANANSRCAKATEPYQRNRVIIERAYAWL